MRGLLALALLLPAAAFAGDLTGKVTLRGKAEGPVVVYVENVPGARASRVPKETALTQRNMAFVPSGLVVPVGAEVSFPNQDNVFHNVFSLTTGNEFDLGLYRGGASKSETFDQAGEVDVFCNIHPDMVARILVVQNDFYGHMAEDGTYSITGIPAGKYTIVAWSPVHTPVRVEVEVGASGKVARDFTLERRDEAPHTNKDGEQYGRYH